jgi:hypothetical protein
VLARASPPGSRARTPARAQGVIDPDRAPGVKAQLLATLFQEKVAAWERERDKQGRPAFPFLAFLIELDAKCAARCPPARPAMQLQRLTPARPPACPLPVGRSCR